MEPLESVLHILNLSTNEITTEKIQDVLSTAKKINIADNHDDYINTILNKIWLHLKIQLSEFEDQLLMSICFYSVLNHSKNQEFYLREIDKVIKHDIKLKNNDAENGQALHLSVSLSYGMFQSSYLHNIHNELLNNVLDTIYSLTSKMAYEYSQYTFIIFKIMVSFKKVVGTQFQKILYNRKYQIFFLNLINHNWENPITGVRSLNRILFQTLISVLDCDVYTTILYEINTFYWNKAKFLMLAETIEHYNGNVEEIIIKYNWVEGLIYSLYKPGLVSAGTDMYNSILKKISSDNTWMTIFLSKVMEILSGTSFKAIENFINYWCLNTLKKFPGLINIFMNGLNKMDDSEYKLYSTICIMKQGNKLGLIERTWNVATKDDKVVPLSIEHCNTSIRMLAFELICISQGKYIPTEIEYQQVLIFLQNNVNSDCTVLRICMTNSLTFFLNKLHSLYLNNIKAENVHDTNNLKNFCLKLQKFVVESLDFDGNYQRKTTTIKIVHTILKCVNDISEKKQSKQGQSKHNILTFLKANECWILDTNTFILKLISLLKDPANDVQQGVLQVLSKYYLKELSDTIIINQLIEDGLTCIRSKFFYEISCGHNIFQLIIHIIFMNNKTNCQFKKVEDIFEFAYKELIKEYNNQNDIVQSIENGKQLHSFLSLMSILFVTFVKKSYKFNINRENILKLLYIMDNISKQFVCEDESQTSSDFSKMNVMVESLIKSSGLTSNTEDETKISGLHQIVLNSLWLNVKATCELAEALIQSYENDTEISGKCLNIICDVLETSRHKGAIEAAGYSLGQGIHHLTSLNESESSKLPFLLLQKKLNDLLFETSKMSSVTRRGAGLSIMVHRIVSNDNKKGKPLFHYFMKTLLKTCNTEDSLRNDTTSDIDNEKDLPKAIYIHFLTRIVTDSSIASDCMYYSAQLAALAFDNLTNCHWQIRNAALQLYGALIPKLIGQKKASGTDDETIATVACDEFRTHSPKLWEYIIKQIQNQNQTDLIQAHSNLVPILNVLSSIARRYTFSYDLSNHKCDVNLFSSLFNLLGSPIYTVRRLTSQCITNIYSFDTIYEAMITSGYVSENFLHGIILLISCCCKLYYKTNCEHFNELIEKYRNIIKNAKHSYICKWTLEELITNLKIDSEEIITVDIIKNLVIEEKNNRYDPGISLWVNVKIQRYLKNMDWKMMAETLKTLSASEHFENYCNACIDRIQTSTKIYEKELVAISNVLMSGITTDLSVIWELLYNISLKIDLSGLNENNLLDYINKPTYKFRYILPFAARILAKQRNSDILIQLSKCIYLLSNPAYNDVDMRHIASLANNELVNNFANLPDNIKSNIIKTAIILLQDEDDDIRNLSVIVYKRIFKNDKPKHPYICLSKMLRKDFLSIVLQDPKLHIPKICEDILNYIDSINVGKIDNYNPFTNNSKNIYLEVNVLRQSLEMLSHEYK